MKEYNYDEIRQMQEKALERVRDMQAKTSQLVNGDNQKNSEHQVYRNNFYNAVKSSSKADYIKMPVEIDEKISDYDSFEKYFSNDEHKPDSDAKEPLKQEEPAEDISKNIVKEPDTALLLSLLLLLQADKADEELLMSLLYIML